MLIVKNNLTYRLKIFYKGGYMKNIRCNLSILFLLILAFFNINMPKIYASEDFKVNLELNDFMQNKVKQSLTLNQNNQSLKNISNKSQIHLSFEDKEPNTKFALINGNNLNNFITLTKQGDTKNLIPTHFEVKNFIAYSFNQIILIPKQKLEENTNYELNINSDKIAQTYGKNLSNTKFKLLFTTKKEYSPSSIKLKKYTNHRFDAEIEYNDRINSIKNTDVDVDTLISPNNIIVNINPPLEGAILNPMNQEDVKIDIEPSVEGFNAVLSENKLILSSKASLKEDTEYILIIHKDKFSYNDLSGNKINLGKPNEKEQYRFKTEKSPDAKISSNTSIIDKDSENPNMIIEFDRNIEPAQNYKIVVESLNLSVIDNKSPDTKVIPVKDARIQDNKILIRLDKDDVKKLDINQNYFIRINENTLKRANSINLKARANIINFIPSSENKGYIVFPFNVVSEKERKQQEKQDVEKLAKEPYRQAIAKAIKQEIELRYQAEYGSNYSYKSFDEYIKNKYFKEKSNENSEDFINLYLEQKGYIDDFIMKYGKESRDLQANAKDYMNRYGGFAYSSRERYDNPIFINPFKDDSSRQGYYNYYDYYDYGYKFPELRIGYDMISQENLEKEEELNQKEKELSQREKILSINRNSNFIKTATNSPKIIINTKSRYFTQTDEFENKIQIDMGVEPISKNGRVFIAITPLAQKLGIWVDYNKSTKVTTLSKPKSTVALSLNSSYININGKSENMGIRPIIQNNKMLIPLHYLGKAFGIDDNKISYDSHGLIIIDNN